MDRAKAWKIFGSGWFWAAFIFVGYGTWIAGAALRYHFPSLPEPMGQVPNFRLTDQEGAAFGTEELAGKIWVGAWIDDPQSEVGQQAAGAMEDVLRKLLKAKEFCLVLVGGDPKRTPSPARGRWRSLHGEPDQLTALRPTLGADPRTLVLIDATGQIRGRYGTDKAGQKALLRDFTLLMSLGPKPTTPPAPQNGNTST